PPLSTIRQLDLMDLSFLPPLATNCQLDSVDLSFLPLLATNRQLDSVDLSFLQSSPYLCVNFVSMFFPCIYLVICWFYILWCGNILNPSVIFLIDIHRFYSLRRLGFVKCGLSLYGLQPMQLGSVNGCCSQCFLSKLYDKRIFYCLDQAIRLNPLRRPQSIYTKRTY